MGDLQGWHIDFWVTPLFLRGYVKLNHFGTTPLRYVRICKMQGAEGEGAGSLLA